MAGKPGLLQDYVRMYRKLWADSGHGAGQEQVQMVQFCCVAESREQARAGYERIMKRYLETFADAVVSWEGKSSDQYPGYDKMVASILAMTPQSIIDNNAAFVGTPEDVIGPPVKDMPVVPPDALTLVTPVAAGAAHEVFVPSVVRSGDESAQSPSVARDFSVPSGFKT